MLRNRVFLAGFAALVLTGCTQLAFLAANISASFGDYSRRADLSYGSAPRNTLDVYLPKQPQHAPIIVFFHGGGWNSGDKSFYKFVGVALAEQGYIAVLPNYRLYPQVKSPAFLQDAATAVAWTRERAAAWGGDPQKMFLIGHSAGAHIAVMLALDDEYLRQVGGSSQWLQGVVGLAGPYDFLPFKFPYMNDLFGPPERFPASQPINYVRTDAPPLLLLQGLQDTTVDPNNTRRLAAAMTAAGGRVATRYYEHASHGDLVAAFSSLARNRAPVLEEIRMFIGELATKPEYARREAHFFTRESVGARFDPISNRNVSVKDERTASFTSSSPQAKEFSGRLKK